MQAIEFYLTAALQRVRERLEIGRRVVGELHRGDWGGGCGAWAVASATQKTTAEATTRALFIRYLRARL